MSKPTQTERILDYITEYGSITPLQAMRDLGCYRLAARIHDLKTEGHPIDKNTVTVWNRWGEETRIAQYTINEAD